MKKILFAIAIVALLGLTSCKEGAKCYKVTYTAGVIGVGAEAVAYEWITEEQVETQKAKYVADGYTNIIFTEVPGYTNAAACYALGNMSEYLE